MNGEPSLDRLDSTQIGSYLVTTESGSIYELRVNGDRAVMIRHPAADMPAAATASHLYFDEEPIECHFKTIQVGHPASFVFKRTDRDDVSNYIGTIRATTDVQSIRRLSTNIDRR